MLRSQVNMKPRLSFNRRLMGWLLTLSLCVLTLPSGASWQCLNGTPCPLDCPMLRGASAPGSAICTVAPKGHCARCQSAPAVPTLVSISGKATCSSSPCVLRFQSKPDTALSGKQLLTLPLLAMPPPPVSVLVSVETQVVPASSPLCFLPQRFLRPFSGRAPPILL
ncbi:MAG TPA: hypothetical protein VKU00_30650 [Chthonomonadaceae bacterium]|nr:hypothetical protein [Chthonomonadaceae bacterium]